MFRINDRCIVNKTIIRQEGTYAKIGEMGNIIEIFQSCAGKYRKPHLNVKVLMDDGTIKTFKIGSLDKR